METGEHNGFTSILVTGANGQLGKALQESSGHLASGIFHFYSRQRLDISRPDDIQKAILHSSPGLVINAAAYTAVDKAEEEKEKAFQINRDGARNLAIACRENGIPLIHISTDYVYHNELRRPLLEDDPVSPKGIYAQSKLEGEKAVAKELPNSLIIRTSWLYGVYGHNFVKTMLRLAAHGKTLRVVNDQIGSPTCVHDLAKAILELAPGLKDGTVPGGIYNFSNSGETSWYGFTKEIFSRSGLKPDLYPTDTAGYPTPAERPLYSVLDLEKVTKHLHSTPPSWQESLAKYLPRIRHQLRQDEAMKA